MKWWNDLWLNEGFASYIKYAGVDAVHPDWDVMSEFVSQDLTSALHKDAHISSHPIIQQVFSANEITEIFDGISYKKVRRWKLKRTYNNTTIRTPNISGLFYSTNASTLSGSGKFPEWAVKLYSKICSQQRCYSKSVGRPSS